MCINPIKIRNNSRSFRVGLSGLYTEVPCGHCEECRSKIQNDWFVRLYYEWLYTIDVLKGSTYFITLTFNDANLPYFHVNDKVAFILQKSLQRLSLENEDVASKMADFRHKYGFSPLEYVPFSHAHFDFKLLSKFFKSLRQYFDQKGILSYSQEQIKFFCGTEYGEDEHRPHIHLLLFLPFKIDDNKLLEIVQSCWSVGVQKSIAPHYIVSHVHELKEFKEGTFKFSTPNGKNWNDWFVTKKNGRAYIKNILGFCNYSRKYPPQLCDVEGLNYVVKYVHKKDVYLSSVRFRMLEDYLKIFPRKLDDLKSRYEKMVEYVGKLRNYFPRVHSSYYLGISILDEFGKLDNDAIAKLLVDDKPLSINGVRRRFDFPIYIINRVMYDADDFDNTLRKLSSIGVKVVKLRLERRIEEFVDYTVKCANEFFPLLESCDKAELKRKFFLDRIPTNPQYLKEVAIYKYLFRYVERPRGLELQFDRQCVIDSFFDMLSDAVVSRQYDVECPPSLCFGQAIKYRSKDTWNYEPCFEGFDQVLDYITEVRNIVSRKKCAKRFADYKFKDKSRKVFNNFIY